MENELIVEMVDGVLVDSPELDAFIERSVLELGKDAQYHRQMLTAFANIKAAKGESTPIPLH